MNGFLPVGGAIDDKAYFSMIMGGGLTVNTMVELPVFEPNDYFWKHHWDGKEDKVILYCRTVQQITADAIGKEYSESSIKDKLTYKSAKKKGLKVE